MRACHGRTDGRAHDVANHRADGGTHGKPDSKPHKHANSCTDNDTDHSAHTCAHAASVRRRLAWLR